MLDLLYIGMIGLLWIVNLFVGTGLDSVYSVTDKAKMIILIISLLMFILLRGKNGRIVISKRDFISFGLMGVLFLMSSLVGGNGLQAMNYLWVFALVFFLSQWTIDEKVFIVSGILYCIGGLFILSIYNYGSILKGWNSNAVAMIGMDSFLIFLIPLLSSKRPKSKFLVLLVLAFFEYLIYQTSSRSCMLFLVIAVAFSLNILPRKPLLQGKKILALLIPLLIAIVVISLSGTSIFEKLESWSYDKFNKPFFNGRDTIWKSGFEVLWSNLLIGTGNLKLYNWHNSAIHCLTAFGILGYLFWISSLKNILDKANSWEDDDIIQGCVICFIVLYWQQSVELGFISHSPSLLPYTMLGMMLGRIRYLKLREEIEYE